LQNGEAEDPPHRMLGETAASGPHVVAKLIFGPILQQLVGPH
jgi:hypothetical protein